MRQCLAVAVVSLVWVLPAALADPDGAVIDLPGFPVEGLNVFVGLRWEDQWLTVTESSIDSGFGESLRALPGMVVQSGFGDIDPPRISVRGSGLQSAPVSRGVWIEQAGAPLNAADGSFNLALVETLWLQQLQLTPGAWAAVPAMGGRLRISDVNEDFERGSELRIRLGSYGRRVLGVRNQGRMGNGQWSAAFTHTELDGWRERSGQRRDSLQATILLPMGGNAPPVRLQAFAVRSVLDVPGPLSKPQIYTNPKSNTPRVQMDQPRRESEQLRVSAGVETEKAFQRFSATMGASHSDDSFRQLLPNGIAEEQGPDAFLQVSLLKEWPRWDGHETRFEFCLQSGSRRAERYRNAGGSAGERIGLNRLRADTFRLHLQHELPLAEAWSLRAGLTGFSAERRVQERFSGRPSTALSLKETHWTPALSLHWQASSRLEFWAAQMRSFEPPTFADLLFTTGPMASRELASRALQWQRADSSEWGIRAGDGPIAGSLSVYYADWRNELLRLVDANGASWGTVNAGNTRHRGLQATVDVQLLELEDRSAQMRLNYVFSEAHFRQDPAFAGNRLAGLPRHLADLRLQFDWQERWQLEPALYLRWGQTYADHANTLTYGSAVDLSLGVAYRAGDNWSTRVQFRNLLNRRQIASPAGVLDRASMGGETAVFLPGAPRQIQWELNYSW